MPKLLPLTDFRARRTVLMRRDFGDAPGPAPLPSNIIAGFERFIPAFVS